MVNIVFVKLWLQIIQTSGARTYALLISLFTVALTARYLGPDGRGVFSAALAWVGFFSTFGSLSLGQVVLYHATGKKREEWLSETLGTLLIIVSVSAAIGWGIVFVGYGVTDGALFQHLGPQHLVLAFAALPLMLWIEDSNAILMALDSLKIWNVAQVVGASCNLLLIVIFVAFLGWGISGALFAVFLYQFVVAGISFQYVLRQTTRIRVHVTIMRQLLTGSIRLHLNAIGTFLFTQATVLVINNFRPPEETGYYQLSMQLVNAIQVIPVAINMVVYTIVTREGPDRAWPAHRKLLGQAVLLMAAISLALYMLAPLPIRIVGGVKFLPAVDLFRILLLGVVGMTFSTVMASQWIARGLFLQAALITVALGIIDVTATYLVVPRYGIIGAAWVTVFDYFVSVIGNGSMALWVEYRWRKSRRGDA